MVESEITFNMAQQYYDELHLLRLNKIMARINDDLIGYNNIMDEIFVHISFCLTEKELSYFEELFKTTNALLHSSPRHARGYNFVLARRKLHEADILMQRILKKNHMLFPPAALRGLALLDGRYKINEKEAI